MTASRRAGTVRVGISGWTYAPWRGVFYPKDLAHKRELAYAASRLGAIEINGTFYSLQRPESFARWRDETPDDFVFAVKAPRFMTHMLRLRRFETPLANFLASGLLRLGPKLGPILWQFPPNMKFDPDLFAPFLAALPRSQKAAAEIAKRHDEKVRGRVWTSVETDRPMRHAVEIRHESFKTPDFVQLLRRSRAALVCSDAVDWPRLMDVTSDFVYCRLHGSQELYSSGYDDPALKDWGRRIRAWSKGGEPRDVRRVGKRASTRASGRDVFVFFDNDAKVRAPGDAMRLAERLGVEPRRQESEAAGQG